MLKNRKATSKKKKIKKIAYPLNHVGWKAIIWAFMLKVAFYSMLFENLLVLLWKHCHSTFEIIRKFNLGCYVWLTTFPQCAALHPSENSAGLNVPSWISCLRECHDYSNNINKGGSALVKTARNRLLTKNALFFVVITTGISASSTVAEIPMPYFLLVHNAGYRKNSLAKPRHQNMTSFLE